jgi:O-methyltransferase involved in polyketide biosynthesis
MEKLHFDELIGVSETLLIPLHYRVEESRNGSSVFKDGMGERFDSAIEYDWNKLQANPFMAGSWQVRTAILDEQVGRFLAKAHGRRSSCAMVNGAHL